MAVNKTDQRDIMFYLVVEPPRDDASGAGLSPFWADGYKYYEYRCKMLEILPT